MAGSSTATASQLPLFVVLFASLLAAGLVSLAASAVLGRDLAAWEFGSLAALACLLLVAWRRRHERRQRQRREGLRDSALW